MHVRGSRSITREVLEILAGGRTFEEQLEHTKREGIVFTAEVLRNSIIGGLEIWRKRRTAQNLIIFGCACYGTALPVKSYFQLLDRLGIEYTFLRKEYCCGAPFIAQAVLQGANRDQADQASRELLGMNIEQARGLSARRMFYLCSWCVYLARRFYPDADIGQNYYADLLVERLEQESLRLDSVTIGYFPGGQHRRHVYVPDIDFDLDWQLYRKLLDRIEGLRVVDLPKYCCVIAPEAIFQRAKREGLTTIITPCLACYGRLVRRAPEGMRVRFFADLLLAALGDGKL